jgi:hypothetical protein
MTERGLLQEVKGLMEMGYSAELKPMQSLGYRQMVRFLSSIRRKVFDGKIALRLVPIKDEEFSHPYSTNVGVSVASGDLVCITNGHCR